MDTLAELVAKASAAALGRVRSEHGTERLCGFALCTDDNFTTLYPVACTDEFVASQGDPNVAYFPTEWTYDEGTELFDGVRQALQDRGGRGLEEHVAQSFRALVRGLLRIRGEADVPSDVFLAVLSTDAGPQLQSLQEEGIRALNAAKVADAWKSALS
jgi:hypothetical protein